MGNGIGIIAMLLGGWVLYRHFATASTPTTGTTGGGTAGPGGTQTLPPAGTPSTTPTTNGAAPPLPQNTMETLPIAQATPLAAAGDRQWAQVLTDRNVLYDVDHWNYFRTLAGQPPIDASDMPTLVAAGEEGMLITANEYLNRLARLSVSTWHTL